MTIWQVANGQSIQAAIVEAADGDTIEVGAGTYTENLTIDKAVTIVGANTGIAGTGARDSETIIKGTTTVTATTGPVRIDGVEIFNTSNAGTQFIGVSVHTASDVTIENSIFFSPVANGSNDDRAISLDTAAQGHIVIANNLVTGDATGQFSTASWHRGIWSDGAASQLDVTGNTFENVRSGMNLDGYDDAHTNISGNTFTHGGTGIAIGTPVTSAITGIHDNTFKDVADDFNLKNVDAAHPQSFDADATHNIAVASGGDTVVLHVLGTLGADTLTGTAGVDVLEGGAGYDTLDGGTGDDILLGSDGNDTLDGGAGADTLIGGAGTDTAAGGADNDTYVVDNSGDVVTENANEGIDTVQSSVDYVLSANVENLTLTDAASNTQTFDDMALGSIANGENGWKVLGPARDQAVVDLGGGNHAFHISSDPASGDFGGPYSPALSVAAGETGLSPYQNQSIKFDFKAVSSTVDGSRLEIDFANASGTDRNNFLLIESTDTGLRIAVNEPLATGDWATNDFDAFTGNRTLISGVDQTVSHHLEMRLTYVDGSGNDQIGIYLDGALIGTTTTFENYHDFHLEQDHDAAASANLTSRVLFRTGGNPPNDGAGGLNQGFNIDNLTTAVYNNTSGTGNEDANVITGNSGDNALSGLGGNDTLLGGDGNDTLDGGAGIDTAVYAGTLAQPHSESGHWVVDSGVIGAGTDTLSNIEIVQHAGGRYLLVGNGGFATAADAAAAATHAGDTLVFATPPVGPVDIDLGGTDDDLDLTIPGNGDVNITTGEGDNHITVGGGDDHVTTGGGDDTIHTGDGDDVVHAGGGDDAIVGGQGGGNDLYDGGSGVNTVEYSSATHSITVDLNEINRSGDPIIGGVLATAALPANTPVGYAQGQDIGVDVLTNVQSATGGSGDDTIIGNSFNNILDGGIGANSLTGGAGNDTYVVDSIGDVVTEAAGQGVDTVIASTHYRLAQNVENLTLTGSADLQAYGNSDANTLTGNAGNDLLSGEGGADTMHGGAGNDVFFADDASDVATENLGEGNDTVFSTAHMRLSANVENLVLQGSADLQGYGNSENNVLYGNAGSNLLDGGVGADFMFGGAGNDVYFVDNAADGVFENANEGTDVVLSTAHFRLSDNVEALVLQGNADLQGYGNSDANVLFGNAGNNILNGEGGADAMVGGAGNDIYFVDNAGDSVFENAGEGTDAVFSTAHFRLSENVETLVLQGSADLQGYGNSDANKIYGNTGSNLLNGEGGADIMLGGAGNDVYFVDNIGDRVIENLNDGTDAVFSTIDYTLTANVETLVLQGSDNLSGVGNASSNSIHGNAGDNQLNGGAGADVLIGNAGDDTFVFNALQADGDTILDFDGQGAGTGDSLSFVGFGTADDGATFTQIDATNEWVIHSGLDAHDEIITFMNGAAPDTSDWHFV